VLFGWRFTRPHVDEEDKVRAGGAKVEEAAAFEVAERGFDPGILDPPEGGEGTSFEEDAAGPRIGEEEKREEPGKAHRGVGVAVCDGPGEGRHPGMGAAAGDPREAVDERGGKAVHRSAEVEFTESAFDSNPRGEVVREQQIIHEAVVEAGEFEEPGRGRRPLPALPAGDRGRTFEAKDAGHVELAEASRAAVASKQVVRVEHNGVSSPPSRGRFR
jgi:hypothetical protein